MEFKNVLDNYINTIGCTPKQLSTISGVSTAVISRYRNGKRIPTYQSIQLINLAKGLEILAEKNNIPNINQNDILLAFNETLNNSKMDFEQFSKNFNELILLFKINIGEISKTLNFDASYVSRIRTGQRRPSDPIGFTKDISDFIVHRYSSDQNKKIICTLLNCNIDDIQTKNDYQLKLNDWLCNGTTKNNHPIDNFLKKLNDFDLNEYIRVIHFNDLKVPTIPFKLPTSKNYYGIKEMRNGELDFFKTTVISKSMEPIFMCSDMPITEMAEDIDFGKKWMFAIAMSLKKGLHLNIIHDISRPFNELMLGLESWIPIYMTGQVSPYYFKGEQHSMYYHFTYVSGSACLSGDAVKNFHNKGKYHLSNNKEDIAYYKNKAECLLKNANPLFQIYRSDSANIYKAFVNSESKTTGKRLSILSSPPIYTISKDLLLKILKRNKISDEKTEKILEYYNEEKNIINNILNHGSILDEILELSEEEFNNYPVTLSLSGMFTEDKIYYSYKEYLEHLKLLSEFTKHTANYSMKLTHNNAFRNIQILIHENKWVMISKNINPSIHFIIHHSKLRNAITNFIAPVIE